MLLDMLTKIENCFRIKMEDNSKYVTKDNLTVWYFYIWCHSLVFEIILSVFAQWKLIRAENIHYDPITVFLCRK